MLIYFFPQLSYSSNNFFKPEHTIWKLFIIRRVHFRVIGVWMIFIEELYDVKSAAIHIKMNVSLFKIGRHGFPNAYFWMKFFDFTPRCIADALAMNLW